MPKIAVVLSGCGVYDGSEVHEATAALAAITRGGAEIEVFAPDIDQHHVIDHIKGTEMPQTRNVLIESSRISRTPPRPLCELTVDQADAVVFPGGFGAAKNLSTFGFEGGDMKMEAETARVISDFHAAGKPQAMSCISPVMTAKVLGSKGVTLTLGGQGTDSDWPYQGSIDVAKGFGANVQLKRVDEVCVDATNKIVTTPAYMSGTAKFHEVQDGVSRMVEELLKMVSSLRIIYFPVRARAEVARMILNYGSIPYTDDICTFDSFPEVKPKLPTGQLPVLAVGDKMIGQSGAIDRYLASLVPGLLPEEPVLRAQCDMIRETIQDLVKIQPIANVFTGEKFKEEKEEFFKNTLPSRLDALVKTLSTKQYFCGEKVAYCDFAVYHHLELCELVKPDVFESLPTIKTWMRRIEELSGVKEYLRDRPKVVGIGENPKLV